QRLAEAQISRGDNLIDLSRVDAAEQAYRQALESLERLVSELGDPQYRESLARAANGLGLLLKESSRSQEAEKMLRRAIALREKLIEESPQTLESRRQLAQSLVNLGGLLFAQRRVDDAQRAF